MGEKMKISKKGGIVIFCLLGLLMALVIILHENPGPTADPQEELLKKILSCSVILVSCIVFAKWYEKFTTIPVELYQSRHLIWKLAKNDFKKRYAGSYMGALWALAQLLPGAKGFAFGILTFALFLGCLPGYLHIGPALSPAGAAAGAAVFLLLLQAALRKGR